MVDITKLMHSCYSWEYQFTDLSANNKSKLQRDFAWFQGTLMALSGQSTGCDWMAALFSFVKLFQSQMKCVHPKSFIMFHDQNKFKIPVCRDYCAEARCNSQLWLNWLVSSVWVMSNYILLIRSIKLADSHRKFR